MNSHACYGKTIIDTTKEENALHFFYDGVSPWINRLGYRWSVEEEIVSRKFVRFSYDVYCALKDNYDIKAPSPNHRDYEEDRETFDYFVDTNELVDFVSEWECYDELIGTRLEYLLLEFCYTWVDVTSGKPGKFTQEMLEAEDDDAAEEERGNLIPEANWSRRRHDLY
jgi:hypothetical protein